MWEMRGCGWVRAQGSVVTGEGMSMRKNVVVEYLALGLEKKAK